MAKRLAQMPLGASLEMAGDGVHTSDPAIFAVIALLGPSRDGLPQLRQW
jgi:hypothetical protein